VTSFPLVRLDQVAEVRLGRQRAPKDHHGDHMRPYLRAANVGWSGLRLGDVNRMNFTDAELETYRLLPGDLLLSEASGSPGEVGKPALWLGQIENCAFQNTLLRVRPHVHDPSFLLHYFRFVALSGGFVPEARGVGIAHLGRARLAGWLTPLPSGVEQRRIVEILEDHLSRLDAADRSTHACQRRLILVEEAGLRRLGVLEPHEMELIGSKVLDVRGGWSRSGKHIVDASQGVPYIKMNNVTRRGRLELDKVVHVAAEVADVTKYGLLVGDILFNSKNSGDLIGKTAVVDKRISGAVFNENLIRLRFDESLLSEFVAIWFRATVMRNAIREAASASTNVAAVYQQQLLNMSIWVPTISVQAAVVEEFETLRVASERLQHAAVKAQTRSRSLRQAVLAAAFEGKLTGRHTDDEIIEEMAAAR
jgi:type I restriction enzyme S subunit